MMAQINTAKKNTEHLATDIINFRDTSDITKITDSAKSIMRNNEDQALLIFNQALNASIDKKYEQGIAILVMYISTIYSNKGMYQENINFLNRIINISKKEKYIFALTAAYNSMGNMMQISGDYDSASYYFYEVINTIEANPEKKFDIGSVFSNLSTVLIMLNEREKALHYLDIAEQKAILDSNTHLQALVLINKGNIYTELKNWEISDSIYHQSLQISRKNNHKQWEYLSLLNIGNILFLQEKYKEAIPYVEMTMGIEGDIDPFYSNAALTTLGKIYFYSDNLGKAETTLKKALKLAHELHIVRDIQENNKILSHLYWKKGDFKNAFSHYYQYTEIKDSIVNEERLRHNNMLEVKYRTAQKDKEIIAKQLDIDKKKSEIKSKNLWIGIIGVGLLLLSSLAALLYSLYRNSMNQKQVQEEKLKNLHIEQEIVQLKAMMEGEEKTRTQISQDLHDGIGGMLASIKMNLSSLYKEYPMLDSISGIKNIANMLTETSLEVRKTAHNLIPDILSRASLKEALIHYCENINQSNLQLGLHYDDDITIPKNSELFIYRIIQELIQNIIKHAQADRAIIQIMKVEDALTITVEDDGIGMDGSIDNQSGTGLKNIRSRIETLDGYFSISSSKKTGTCIHIEIEISKLQNLN